MVHGRLADVERERRNRLVHQDAEVVAQIRAGHAERPHGGEHQGVAGEEERDGGVFDERGEEGGVRRLRGEGFVVAVVS